MNFLQRIFSGQGSGKSRPQSERLYLFDANGLVDTRQRNGGGHPSPRDLFFALKDLARFREKEGVNIIAFFLCRPLREASDGENYKGVTVYYAGNSEGIRNKILKTIKQYCRRKDVVVLTSDIQLERAARQSGAECMRLSTFKKALEEVGREGRERSRPPAQRRRPAAPRPPEQEAKPQPSAVEKPDSNQSDVLDLIDPL